MDEIASFEGLDQKMVTLVFKFPLLTRPEDEVGEKTLVKWIHKSYAEAYHETANRYDIFGCITKLSAKGYFIKKAYGNHVILKPTQNYFRVKQGKSPIAKKKTTFQSVLEEPKEESPLETCLIKPSIGSIQIKSSENCLSYMEYLQKRINSYEGPDKKLIAYFPPLYHLACNILNDQYTDWHTKMLISSALGYYILEYDIIPDDKELGYLDDLFILSYVLHQIEKHVSPNLLEDNWNYQENVHEVIENVYHETYNLVEDFACEILHKVGIWKFKELELEEYSGTYQDRIAKLAHEKRELMGLLAYLVKVVYHTNIPRDDLSKIKEFLMKYGDYTEIERLIQISLRDHDIIDSHTADKIKFEEELEEELRRARLNAILEENDEMRS